MSMSVGGIKGEMAANWPANLLLEGGNGLMAPGNGHGSAGYWEDAAGSGLFGCCFSHPPHIP